jgi:signal transduction histidine kinase
VGEPLRITLLYSGQREGELVAAPREPDRGFSAADRRTLEAVGRQVAVAAHAVRLAHDLRGSRERLVLAREEERRRLRRDLHDELGPTLAALALELETAQADRADVRLERAALRAREAVADVRRLVHDLRPPTLDELGLVGALREQAHRLSASVDAPDDLGPLPAAVEAAAYRIASEALANAVRHAGASTCVVGLERQNGRLFVWVRDDGSGIPVDARPGVGLTSMRERAEELGGTLEVVGGAGTQVRAILPVP